jgi:hypothetical protein
MAMEWSPGICVERSRAGCVIKDAYLGGFEDVAGILAGRRRPQKASTTFTLAWVAASCLLETASVSALIDHVGDEGRQLGGIADAEEERVVVVAADIDQRGSKNVFRKAGVGRQQDLLLFAAKLSALAQNVRKGVTAP